MRCLHAGHRGRSTWAVRHQTLLRLWASKGAIVRRSGDEPPSGPPFSEVTAAAEDDALSRAKLSQEQLIALASTLRTTGPMEVNRLLDTYARTTDESGSFFSDVSGCLATIRRLREQGAAGPVLCVL